MVCREAAIHQVKARHVSCSKVSRTMLGAILGLAFTIPLSFKSAAESREKNYCNLHFHSEFRWSEWQLTECISTRPNLLWPRVDIDLRGRNAAQESSFSRASINTRRRAALSPSSAFEERAGQMLFHLQNANLYGTINVQSFPTGEQRWLMSIFCCHFW